MAVERPRPCGCAPELRRSVLFPEGRDFTALACSSCGALVAFHTERGAEIHPHAEPEQTYRVVPLAPELVAWLGGFPRYVPYTAPWCFLPGAARFATAAELESAEAEARAAQASLGLLERLNRAGIPAPNRNATLTDFDQVASVGALSLPELLELSARGQRLVAELASERLARRESLATELAALIRAGGDAATGASRTFFRLRPTDPAARRTIAEALSERLLVLCEQPAFAAETELSEHVLALVTLGADAAPASAVLPVLRASQLFALRSLLRDHVSKIEAALSSRD